MIEKRVKLLKKSKTYIKDWFFKEKIKVELMVILDN